jgi:hypothetical protein
MIISIINHADATVSDAELHRVVRAINRQLACDFAPYWSYGAQLRLEGRSGDKPDKQSLADMRGDAVIYLWDKADIAGALGYHDANNRGVPYGFVFTDIAKQLKEEWSVTLSHEALELLGDAEANLLVQGPHPEDASKVVYHWYEMCDAVQAESYEIDGVAVSNFVLPLYFTSGDELGGRNDFLGTRRNGKSLTSFGVNAGGYIGFFDPEKNDHVTFSRRGDAVAARRLAVKAKLKATRRSYRYRNPTLARPQAAAAE